MVWFYYMIDYNSLCSDTDIYIICLADENMTYMYSYIQPLNELTFILSHAVEYKVHKAYLFVSYACWYTMWKTL